jgi:hypothetical protein
VAAIIDPVQCAGRFGLGPEAWKSVCLWGIMFNQLAAPLRYDSGRRRALGHVYADAAEKIAAGASPESVDLANVGIPAPVPVAAPPPRVHFRNSISW